MYVYIIFLIEGIMHNFDEFVPSSPISLFSFDALLKNSQDKLKKIDVNNKENIS